jgi:hypothetical protein
MEANKQGLDIGALPLCFAEHLDPAVRAALGYRDAVDALLDPRGETVRCTPSRRTSRIPAVAGRTLFRKVAVGRAALAEWRNLAALEAAGFRVPARVCAAAGLGSSVVVTAQAPGRPLDVLLAEAARRGELTETARRAARAVAPAVRELHARGWCHRDLYASHLFWEPGAPAPVLIDVQRLFRPRFRRRRWRVKDLAALWSSMPPQLPPSVGLRFLALYLGRRPRRWRRLARAVDRKARRIRGHAPRYG